MATKGQKFKQRTAEEKYEIIKPILENLKSQTQVSKDNNINIGLIFQWVQKYNEKDFEGLNNKTNIILFGITIIIVHHWHYNIKNQLNIELN